jgi:Fe-S-cluster containining protein
VQGSVRRFACTQCGKCCDRAPEVELSEAAALADIFVFRLMFRLYSLPRVFDRSRSDAAEVFYQKKRLLSAHAACVSAKKVKRDGRPIEHLEYLMISALALDTAPGTCAALSSGRCSIYERRPLACRTVPLHYARAEGVAESDLDAFVSTRGYRCDLSEDAPVVLESGRIVDEGTRQARSDALDLVRRDRPWKEAIVRRMKVSSDACLPTLLDIEANAAFGPMTTSMRVGWEIAAAAGLIGERQTHALLERQLATVERELDTGRASGDDRQTLQEMSAEYRHALAG